MHGRMHACMHALHSPYSLSIRSPCILIIMQASPDGSPLCNYSFGGLDRTLAFAFSCTVELHALLRLLSLVPINLGVNKPVYGYKGLAHGNFRRH